MSWRYAACSVYRLFVFSMVALCLPHKRPADKDRNRQHPGRVHGHTFDLSCIDTDVYSGPRCMYRLFVFSMVALGLPHKRPADEDRNRQHTLRMHRHTFGLSCIDTDVYSGPCCMHFVYIWKLDSMRFDRPSDKDCDRRTCRMHRDARPCTVDSGL